MRKHSQQRASPMQQNKRRGRQPNRSIAAGARKRSTNSKPYEMKQVLIRLEPYCLRNLDRLCKMNNRSRPDLLSILIDREADALKDDPKRRINP